jgi:hypothetical protein
MTVRRREEFQDHPYGQTTCPFFIFEMAGLEPKTLNQYLYPTVDHLFQFSEQITLFQDENSAGQYKVTCILLQGKYGLHCLLLNKADEPGAQGRYRQCGLMNIEYRLHGFAEGWRVETVTII